MLKKRPWSVVDVSIFQQVLPGSLFSFVCSDFLFSSVVTSILTFIGFKRERVYIFNTFLKAKKINLCAGPAGETLQCTFSGLLNQEVNLKAVYTSKAMRRYLSLQNPSYKPMTASLS